MTKLIHILFLSLFTFQVMAQTDAYKEVKTGNQFFKAGDYEAAELNYRKGIDIDTKNAIPTYNLGNAKYAQKDFEAATQQYESSAELFETKKDRAEAYHNKGNALLEQKEYEASIKEYKKALKLFPDDLDTKYNLAYAQLKLQKEQEQQKQEEEKKQDQKEKEEEKQDENKEQEDKGDENEEKEKDKNKDQESEEDGENKEDGENEKNQDKKEKETGNKPGEMTQEQAEQFLNSINIKEGKLKEKLDKDKEENIIITTDKDW